MPSKQLAKMNQIGQKVAEHYRNVMSVKLDVGSTDADIAASVSTYLSGEGNTFVKETGLSETDLENMFRTNLLGRQMKEYKTDSLEEFMQRDNVASNLERLDLRSTDVNIYRETNKFSEHRQGFITKAMFSAPGGDALKLVMTENSGKEIGKASIKRAFRIVQKKEEEFGEAGRLTSTERAEATAYMHHHGATPATAEKIVTGKITISNNKYVMRFRKYWGN